MKVVFVTERPTQILTSIAICEQLKHDKKTQIIVANCFDDAVNIVKRFNEVEYIAAFELVENYEKALERAAEEFPSHLFIHWDVGLGTQKRLRRLKQTDNNIKIFVFEEGVGTYREDIYRPLKRKVLGVLGFPVNIGGSRYTNGIYVYDKDKYNLYAKKKPKEVIQITESLTKLISKNISKLLYIFAGEKFITEVKKNTCRNCCVYLSNWSFSIDDIDLYSKKKCLKILKLHPYCKAEYEDSSILIAPKSLPAEILLISILSYFEKITVYHHNSSSELYLNEKNICFKSISCINDE